MSFIAIQYYSNSSLQKPILAIASENFIHDIRFSHKIPEDAVRFERLAVEQSEKY